MSTTVQQATSTISAFSAALEQRDPLTLLALYSEQAEICLANSSIPHRSPRIVRGKTAIAHWVHLFCDKNQTVFVANAVDRDSEFTIIAECRRVDGTRFVLACTAKMTAGLVTDQFVVVV